MKVLKSMSGVAAANLSSRLLGMLRDILFASVLGGGTLMSAWVYIFLIPNLFRRILGEGALGSALIRMLKESLEKNGNREKAGINFLSLTVLLGGILGGICIIIAVGALCASYYTDSPDSRLILRTLPVIIPYALFICLTGIAGSALNCLKNFFLPALTSLFLNIFLIASLYFIVPHLTSAYSILITLSLSVLCAGFLQLMILLIMLNKAGLFRFSYFRFLSFSDPFVKDVFKLAWPSALGAGALQLSMFIDKSLALYLGNYAVPALYYSDRIVFITIGIFAVSLNTVMLPDMSGFAVRKDYKGLSNGISSGVRHMLFICIPAAVFTFMFRFEIIRLLFMRGAFDTAALNETAFALAFYSLGIPFFATVKILVSAFHSQKKMMLPVRISIICICVNIVLNIVLMQYIRQGGIALATVIASLLNNLILFYFLRRDLSHLKLSDILYSGVMILLAALAAGASAYMTVHYFLTGLSDLKAILILFSVFSIVFLSVSALLRLDELGDWLNIIRRKRV